MIKISLNGLWKCKPDNYNIGIQKEWHHPSTFNINDPSLIKIKIPDSFNHLTGYETFEGIFWHFFKFDFENLIDLKNKDYKIRFKGSNYNTRVWINGTYLGEHNGGFTPFSYTINDVLKKKENFLAVRTENIRKKNRIPAIFFDWFNWGGLYRDVDILILNKNRVKDVVIKTLLSSFKSCEIKIHYKSTGPLKVKWQILDPKEIVVSDGNIISKVVSDNEISISLNKPQLWSPEAPYLYKFRIKEFSKEFEGQVLYQCQFGIRQIEVKGMFILLNKRRIKLKGISLHEEYMPYGRTIPYDKRLNDVKTIKSLGFNALRTAHYPHDESLLEIADQKGLLILEEIPVYWNCNYKSTETFKVAAKMLRELIKRDINHPSVIWWSVGNEIPIHKRECSKFIKRLILLARRYDDTRIITYVSRKLIYDFTRRYADVATLNTYFGWYFGHEKLLSLFFDIVRTPLFNKPWIFTEFGAGAKYGYHDDWKNQTKFSEERQLQLLDYTIRTINSKDYISGWFIWIFRDFRSLAKCNKFQQGYNRKGIESEKSYEKKLIYYRIPQIIDKSRKTLNSPILGIVLWILFFPFSYFILTHLINFFAYLYDKTGFKKGFKKVSYTNMYQKG